MGCVRLFLKILTPNYCELTVSCTWSCIGGLLASFTVVKLRIDYNLISEGMNIFLKNIFFFLPNIKYCFNIPGRGAIIVVVGDLVVVVGAETLRIL